MCVVFLVERDASEEEKRKWKKYFFFLLLYQSLFLLFPSQNQKLHSCHDDAFKCFFYDGTADGSGSDVLAADPLPEGCTVDAWHAVMIYVVSYGINVFVCMALVKEMSAVFCVVFGAMVLPTTTICFSIGALTVRNVECAEKHHIVHATVLFVVVFRFTSK